MPQTECISYANSSAAGICVAVVVRVYDHSAADGITPAYCCFYIWDEMRKGAEPRTGDIDWRTFTCRVETHAPTFSAVVSLDIFKEDNWSVVDNLKFECQQFEEPVFGLISGDDSIIRLRSSRDYFLVTHEERVPELRAREAIEDLVIDLDGSMVLEAVRDPAKRRIFMAGDFGDRFMERFPPVPDIDPLKPRHGGRMIDVTIRVPSAQAARDLERVLVERGYNSPRSEPGTPSPTWLVTATRQIDPRQSDAISLHTEAYHLAEASAGEVVAFGVNLE